MFALYIQSINYDVGCLGAEGLGPINDWNVHSTGGSVDSAKFCITDLYAAKSDVVFH